jgi:hypothetical protein
MSSLEPSGGHDLEPVRSRGLEVSMQLHAVTWVVINAMLIGIWAMTGAGYFWPFWTIVPWGALVLIHGWLTYGRVRD